MVCHWQRNVALFSSSFQQNTDLRREKWLWLPIHHGHCQPRTLPSKEMLNCSKIQDNMAAGCYGAVAVRIVSPLAWVLITHRFMFIGFVCYQTLKLLITSHQNFVGRLSLSPGAWHQGNSLAKLLGSPPPFRPSTVATPEQCCNPTLTISLSEGQEAQCLQILNELKRQLERGWLDSHDIFEIKAAQDDKMTKQLAKMSLHCQDPAS